MDLRRAANCANFRKACSHSVLNKQPLISSGPLTSERYNARKVKKPTRTKLMMQERRAATVRYTVLECIKMPHPLK
jgi:hypothetical protein